MNAEQHLRDAYGVLSAGPGRFVALAAIRDHLTHLDRADVDTALVALLADDAVRLEPEPFGFRITPADRDAAIHVGGEDRHLLAIGARQ